MNLIFVDDLHIPFSVKVREFKVLEQGNGRSCHLEFSCSLKTYQEIKKRSLFNLRDDLFCSSDEAKLNERYPLFIEISLLPQFISELNDYIDFPEKALLYISSLSEILDHQEDHSSKNIGEDFFSENDENSKKANPLVQAKNWLAIGVRQKQQLLQVECPTIWAYISPTYFVEGATDRQFSLEEISQLLKERDKAKSEQAEQAIKEVFKAIEKEFKSFSDPDFLKQTEETISEAFEEIGQAIEDWSKQPFSAPPPSENQIYSAAIRFFSEDDWEFSKLKGEPTLRLAAQGKHDQFTCYAKALDTQHTFIFYSICPVQIPKKKRRIVSELIARINHGLLVGNFELNFETGEIYFKTSIDVEGDRLTSALIKNLVYTNVMTMDQYLPGILAVLEQGTTPEQAIQLVEQCDEPLL